MKTPRINDKMVWYNPTTEEYKHSMNNEWMLNKIDISISEIAIARIKELSTADECIIEFGVVKNGCTGYSYTLEYVTSPVDNSFLELDFDGVCVIINPVDISILSGTEIDYVTEGLSSRFVYNNHNVVDKCGCGNSFSLVESSVEYDDSDDGIIDAYGNNCWFNKAGKLHRENNLPAVITKSGSKYWYKNGKFIRDE